MKSQRELNLSLYDAVIKGNISEMEELINDGADVDTIENGISVLHATAQHNFPDAHEQIQKFKFLLKRGADVNVIDESGYSVLHFAAVEGKTELVKLLLEKEADINAKDKNGQTAMYYAAAKGNKEILSLLINNRANIHSKNPESVTLLHSAAYSGNAESIEFLAESGVDVNAIDRYGNTALHDAASYGKAEAINALIGLGAYIHAKDRNGDTAIHLAARYGRVEAINALINLGADIYAHKNDAGQSAIQCFKDRAISQIVKKQESLVKTLVNLIGHESNGDVDDKKITWELIEKIVAKIPQDIMVEVMTEISTEIKDAEKMNKLVSFIPEREANLVKARIASNASSGIRDAAELMQGNSGDRNKHDVNPFKHRNQHTR